MVTVLKAVPSRTRGMTGLDYARIILAVSLALLLLAAGIEDIRKREIANSKTLAIAALAPLWWLSNGYAIWPDATAQAGIALAVFAAFAAAFYAGMMGGGDVKLIAALALWLPLQPLFWMLIVMALAGGAITLVMLVDHRMRRSNALLEIPYGVAIAIAGLLAIREPVFNHFL